MPDIKHSYETVFILSMKLGDEGIAALIEKFKAQIEENATLESVDESWGKRKLAYPINDELDGYYVIYTFESTPAYPAEFTRKVNITDGVLRSLVNVK